MPIPKTDLVDLDIVDATELAATGSIVFLTVNVTSTTSGTKTVTVALASDGEGILTGRDHLVKAGDKVTLSGTSGANGTYTVNSVLTDTTFNVVEAIATSTGGSAAFQHAAGATNVGVNPTGLGNSSNTVLQSVLSDFDSAITKAAAVGTSIDFLLENEPPTPTNNYANTFSNQRITNETWTRHTGATNIKTIDYTYTNNQLTQEVRKVYDSSGVTVIGQLTVVYTYTGSRVSSATRTRNI